MPRSTRILAQLICFSLVTILQTPLQTHELCAQESSVAVNKPGKTVANLKHAWKAQWITHPTAPTLEYGVFLFRRTFSLEAKPEEFFVYVSADNRYRLYVNGQNVCMGPARGDIDHTRYETVDLAPYLKTGENVVAAEVVNFGEHRHAAQQTFQTAFILQGKKTNTPDIDTGGQGWLITQNSAYSPIPFSYADVHGYYAAGPGDRIDASKYPWGWQQRDFDDHDWLKPRLATVEFAVGRGFPYGSTWFLVPRTIPALEETLQRIPQVARSEGIEVDEQFLLGESPLVIPPNTKASILFDQTYHTVSYPELTLSGGKGSQLKITYSEALFDEQWKKGNRNEIEGKEIRGYYDTILPDGGKQRLFKPLALRTYRFIQFDIQTQDEPLTIVDYHGVYTAYPFEEKAKFECSDPMLQKIWDISWRSLRNAAGETFYDTPYYEQMQYVGDTRIESLASVYVSGDDRLMRKAIELFDDSRLPMGLTQSRYPAYIVQVIPPFSLLWTGMVHDYYMVRDDDEFIRRFLPGIRSVLEWFETRIDETDMVTNLEWWSFVDYTPGYKMGIPPGADDGYSAQISLQYVKAAQDAAVLFAQFGWHHEAEKYLASADRVAKAVFQKCYVAEKGLIAETPDKKIFSQHTQIMAVLTDTIPSADQQTLMKKTLTDDSLIPAMIYYRYYLFRALQKTGLGDKYLNQLGIWKKMIGQGLTTTAEKDDDPRSDSHAWGSSPCIDLLRIVAGIQPAEPGFRSVLVAPNFGHLEHFRAQMPHPAGMIVVDLTRKNLTEVHGTVTLPAGVSGKFQWRDQQTQLQPGSQQVNIKP